MAGVLVGPDLVLLTSVSHWQATLGRRAIPATKLASLFQEVTIRVVTIVGMWSPNRTVGMAAARLSLRVVVLRGRCCAGFVRLRSVGEGARTKW
jgi:hypothetical protein